MGGRLMKNLYALLLAALLVLGLCACGGRTASKETTVPPTQTTETPAEQFSMYDLSRAMLGATTFGEMSYVSSADDGAEADFAYLSDLDYEKVSQFFLAYAANGAGNADEIAVIRVKDSADLPAAEASLKAHLTQRAALYATYDPTQSEKIEAGTVFTSGSFAVLLISDDNEAVKAAFTSFLQAN